MLPVAREDIFVNSKGRCASGKLVFGVRLLGASGARLGADIELDMETVRRSGRGGTAKTPFDEACFAHGRPS